jgi:tetratricopeptide (TPR) repeat protein
MQPRTLTHFRIVERIGAGGMGVVYRAHDEQLERDVAIKVLPPGAISDESARRRFRKEALSLAKLNHANVAMIFEFDNAEGMDFLVTEYIPGLTLDSKLARGPLPAKDVLSLAQQLAQGLTAAHEQGIVHRDLKPSNLRITPDGRLKILDFGLAQLTPRASELGLTATLTTSQDVSGTLPYMAPEQLRGEATDARTDIWAVGAVIYEMATGKRPFPQTNGPLLIDAILNHAPQLPSKINRQVSPDLERVILKALDKNPAIRYQTTAELAADLNRLTAGMRPLAKGPRDSVSIRIAAGVFIVVLLAILGVLGFLKYGAGTMRRQSPESGFKSRRSVAVLGFKNLTGNPNAAWISPAISEMLTTELAEGGQLLTVPGESVAEMKTSLALPEADSYGKETLAKIRKNLGSDDVVLGSYLELGGGQLRVDMKLEDAVSGEIIDSVTESGSDAQISDLISNAGNALRARLGAGATSQAQVAAVKASIPANTEAARYYSEGVEKLRISDALGARSLLQKAADKEPSFAPAHSALAIAWKSLGYNSKALAEAKRGLDLSGNLEREQLMLVEAQYHEIAHEWGAAIDNYRTLFQFFPDNLEYGLRLASAQAYGGKPQDAFSTVDSLRKLPTPARDDPRIDIAEAAAAGLTGDHKRELAASTIGAEKAQAQGARLLSARALLLQFQALSNLGEPEQAAEKAEEAQRIFAQAGNQDMAATALNKVAIVAFNHSDYAVAKTKYEGALKVWREVGDDEKSAAALGNIGQILKRQGDLKGAASYYQQSLDIFRKVENKNLYATMYGNLGNLLNSSGDLPRARTVLEQAAAASREIGNKDLEESDLINLADVLVSQGDLAEAKTTLDQAEPLLKETADAGDLIDSRMVWGNLSYAQGDLAGAHAKFQEALDSSRRTGEKELIAAAGCSLGEIAIEEGHPANAETPCRQAIAEFQAENDTQDEVVCRAVLARALLEQGKTAEAQKEVEGVQSLAAKSQNVNSRLKLETVAAQVRAASGDTVGAERILQAALAEAVRLGFVAHQLEIRLALGEIEMKSGKTAAAHLRLTTLQKEAASKGFTLIAHKAGGA